MSLLPPRPSPDSLRVAAADLLWVASADATDRPIAAVWRRIAGRRTAPPVFPPFVPANAAAFAHANERARRAQAMGGNARSTG
jgi:hypothetical protein